MTIESAAVKPTDPMPCLECGTTEARDGDWYRLCGDCRWTTPGRRDCRWTTPGRRDCRWTPGRLNADLLAALKVAKELLERNDIQRPEIDAAIARAEAQR